jgi:hypothetical protein
VRLKDMNIDREVCMVVKTKFQDIREELDVIIIKSTGLQTIKIALTNAE